MTYLNDFISGSAMPPPSIEANHSNVGLVQDVDAFVSSVKIGDTLFLRCYIRQGVTAQIDIVWSFAVSVGFGYSFTDQTIKTQL